MEGEVKGAHEKRGDDGMEEGMNSKGNQRQQTSRSC